MYALTEIADAHTLSLNFVSHYFFQGKLSLVNYYIVRERSRFKFCPILYERTANCDC